MSPRVGLLVRLSTLLVLASAATAAGQDRRVVSAAANQDAATVRLLLADGVNARRADGATALLWAAHRDDLEMVDLLLRAGASGGAWGRGGANVSYRPRQVSDALRRLAPGLRKVGFNVTFNKHGHGRTRLIEIRR